VGAHVFNRPVSFASVTGWRGCDVASLEDAFRVREYIQSGNCKGTVESFNEPLPNPNDCKGFDAVGGRGSPDVVGSCAGFGRRQ
jgi:hypothetical protein